MDNCLICGQDIDFLVCFRTKSIWANDFFSIGQCPYCTVQKVLNVPSDLARYYENRQMKKPANRLHASLKKILLQRELKRILPIAQPHSLFLDIGCGTGDFTKLIYDHALSVAAADSDQQRPIHIEQNESIPYYTLDYSTYYLKNFSAVDNAIVILRHVLEHIMHPNRFIDALTQYGAKAFYVAVPNHGSIENKLFGQYNFFYDPPRHLWFFNSKSLQTLFLRKGYTLVSSGYDTIPNIVSSFHRFLRIKNCPKPVWQIFNPQGIVSVLSSPLNIFLPNNVLWAVFEKTKQ